MTVFHTPALLAEHLAARGGVEGSVGLVWLADTAPDVHDIVAIKQAAKLVDSVVVGMSGKVPELSLQQIMQEAGAAAFYLPEPVVENKLKLTHALHGQVLDELRCVLATLPASVVLPLAHGAGIAVFHNFMQVFDGIFGLWLTETPVHLIPEPLQSLRTFVAAYGSELREVPEVELKPFFNQLLAKNARPERFIAMGLCTPDGAELAQMGAQSGCLYYTFQIDGRICRDGVAFTGV